MKRLLVGSIFRSSFLLVLGGSLLIALASIAVTFLTPVPLISPISTLDVARALKNQPFAQEGSLLVRREQQAGLPVSQGNAVTETLIAIIARQADVPRSSVRLILGTDVGKGGVRQVGGPGPIFEKEFLESAKLYKGDDRYSPFIFGPFKAALQQPDGSWLIVNRKMPEPKWQYNVARGIVIALLLLLPLTWWFSRRLSAPIIALGKSADKIGAGSFEQVKVDGPIEVRQAAMAMNQMQTRIHDQIKERTEMLAAIAHDLRTPLARLSFLLADQPLSNRARVDDEIAEMDQMIATAMDFARNETVEPMREKIDLRLLLESIVDDFSDMGHAAMLHSGPAITLAADPLMLRRIFTNVIGNAVTHGRKARVKAYDNGKSAIIEVCDEGPGMSESDIARAFDPFFRVERSRSRQTGGIGLGLAVAKRGVEAHQGTIALLNGAEGGLRVLITLPI